VRHYSANLLPLKRLRLRLLMMRSQVPHLSAYACVDGPVSLDSRWLCCFRLYFVVVRLQVSYCWSYFDHSGSFRQSFAEAPVPHHSERLVDLV